MAIGTAASLRHHTVEGQKTAGPAAPEIEFQRGVGIGRQSAHGQGADADAPGLDRMRVGAADDRAADAAAAVLARTPPLSVTLPLPVAEPEEFPATNVPAVSVVPPL